MNAEEQGNVITDMSGIADLEDSHTLSKSVEGRFPLSQVRRK